MPGGVAFGNERGQIMDFEWLAHDAKCAEVQRAFHDFRCAERRHQDDLRVRNVTADRGEQSEVVGLWQTEVEQDDVRGRGAVGDCLASRRRIAGFGDDEALLGERLGQGPPDQQLVIDDQDADWAIVHNEWGKMRRETSITIERVSENQESRQNPPLRESDPLIRAGAES